MPRTYPISWFLTFPQCAREPAELLEFLKPMCWRAAVVREHHKDGHAHLHAFCSLETPLPPKKQNAAFRGFADGNYQPCKSSKAVLKYISKENTPLTYNMDLEALKNKRKSTLTPETIMAKTAKEALMDGDINIHAIRNYNLARSILLDPYEHNDVRGIWIYGRSGVGKSHMARNNYGQFYIKGANKWFDGYAGEETILLDDFGKEDAWLGNRYLKIWADKWSCEAEIKGGTTQLQHKNFIVTSQYKIEELWQDPETVDALTRRFRLITIEKPFVFENPNPKP